MNKILIGSLIIIPLMSIAFYIYNYDYKPKKQSAEIIDAIMKFEMPQVIARCKRDHGYSDEVMIVLEKEFKRYLALFALSPNETFGKGMYCKAVDNLWHSFILFTAEYDDFCNKYIGVFVHHVPEVDDDENMSLEEQEESLKEFRVFVKNYEQTFHEEIHPIWFSDMKLESQEQ